jgi:hypothetical protein
VGHDAVLARQWSTKGAAGCGPRNRIEPEEELEMDIDTDRIDEAVLALLYLGLHEEQRVWKSFDWDALDRLHEKGLISDPAHKSKSVVLGEEGLRESERLFEKLFAKRR